MGYEGQRGLPELLFDFTPGQVIVKSFHISLMFPQYLLSGTAKQNINKINHFMTKTFTNV